MSEQNGRFKRLLAFVRRAFDKRGGRRCAPDRADVVSDESVIDPRNRLTTHSEFGVDAPGVVAQFFAGSVGLATVGVALVARRAGRRRVLLAVPLFTAAGGLGLLGVSMLLNFSTGKQRLRDHILRQRVWRGNELILDVGAGCGLMAIGAAKRAPLGQVIALDIWSTKDLFGNSPEALRRNTAI